MPSLPICDSHLGQAQCCPHSFLGQDTGSARTPCPPGDSWTLSSLLPDVCRRTSLLHTYDYIWLYMIQWEPQMWQAKNSDQWYRYQSLISHNSRTSKQMTDLRILVLTSDFSPLLGLTRFTNATPKSNPGLCQNWNVKWIWGLSINVASLHFSQSEVWETLTRQQLSRTSVSAVGREHQRLSAGRWDALPREASPSSVTPPFPQRHAEHPDSLARQNPEFLNKSSAAIFTHDV